MKSTNLLSGIMNLPVFNSSPISSIGLEWAGKYIASVLDLEFGVLVEPRWTSSPKVAKVFFTKVVPVIKSSLDKKMNAESSA